MPRILHTADWHLGKRLHDFWLLDEQYEALARLLEVVDAERPDLLVVAGDLFDVPVPQVRALQLWEWVADEVVTRRGLPLVVIPGNHDHAERIAMNASMARGAGLYLLNDLAHCQEPVLIAGTQVFGVPFHKPPHVRALQAEDSAEPLDDFDYDAAMAYLLGRARDRLDPELPSLLLAHAFVEGAGEEPEGEEAILVGGAGGVRLDTLKGFDYVALGHLHGPRTLQSTAPVRYSGSLYPYSFGESNLKTVTLVDLPETPGRTPELREAPLPVRRKVRLVTGLSFDQVTNEGLEAREAGGPMGGRPDPDDYLLVRVSDRDPINHALARLREVYPHALLEQPVIDVGVGARRLSGDARTMRVEDAFLEFYQAVYGQAPSELEIDVLKQVLAADEEP